MTKKKRKLTKKQLQKKRSAAAKKGWETRRKKEYEKNFKKYNPELVGVEKQKVEELIAEAEERGRREALKQRTNKEVVEELVRLGKVAEDRDSKIKARLRRAGGPDAVDYYDEVKDIANDDEYLDYSPTEIYTMGFY